MPTVNYDAWKLASPPWYDRKEIRVEECAHCSADLYAGQEVITDGEVYFCDGPCARHYLLEHPHFYVRELVPNTKRAERFYKWAARHMERFIGDIEEDVMNSTVLEYEEEEY